MPAIIVWWRRSLAFHWARCELGRNRHKDVVRSLLYQTGLGHPFWSQVVPVAQIRAMDSPGGLHMLRTTDIEVGDVVEDEKERKSGTADGSDRATGGCTWHRTNPAVQDRPEFQKKVHGCDFGLVDADGQPIQKPWRTNVRHEGISARSVLLGAFTTRGTGGGCYWQVGCFRWQQGPYIQGDGSQHEAEHCGSGVRTVVHRAGMYEADPLERGGIPYGALSEGFADRI
mmetsp:Transcript_5173/g.7208  ORF Transcript_5173/g.7208 Transcript_5173/m.7208 type:complete len:228 (-) Transcript_5173:156-839(-)